jgi:hypothetical protein
MTSASELIDERIAGLGDWRGAALARMRGLIREAIPDVLESWKWMGTPVWEHGGILCTGESYKSWIKLTFLKGASLPDPAQRGEGEAGAEAGVNAHCGEAARLFR